MLMPVNQGFFEIINSFHCKISDWMEGSVLWERKAENLLYIKEICKYAQNRKMQYKNTAFFDFILHKLSFCYFNCMLCNLVTPIDNCLDFTKISLTSSA